MFGFSTSRFRIYLLHLPLLLQITVILQTQTGNDEGKIVSLRSKHILRCCRGKELGMRIGKTAPVDLISLYALQEISTCNNSSLLWSTF